MEDSDEGELRLHTYNAFLKYITEIDADFLSKQLPINPSLHSLFPVRERKKPFVDVLLRDRTLEDMFSNYDEDPSYESIRIAVAQHAKQYRTPMDFSTQEHIFLLHPFSMFFIEGEHVAKASTKQREHYATYVNSIFSLLSFAQKLPTVQVTVLDKPDLYVVGTSYLMEQGLVNDVLFTKADSTQLISGNGTTFPFQSYGFLTGQHILLAGMYQEDIQQQLLKQLYHTHCEGPQFESLQYFSDMLLHEPTKQKRKKHSRFDARNPFVESFFKKSNHVTNLTDYMNQRKQFVKEPEVVNLSPQCELDSLDDVVSSSA